MDILLNVNIHLNENSESDSDVKKLNIILNLNNFKLKINSELSSEFIEKTIQKFNICTLSNLKEMKEWEFSVELENNEVRFVENDNFALFKKFILNQKLHLKYIEKNKEKTKKI